MASVILAQKRGRPRHDGERYAARVNSIRRRYRLEAGRELAAASVQLGYTLGFVDISTIANPELTEYIQKAAEYQEFALKWLADHVGKGKCGPLPASVIATASLQLAASRFAFEKLNNISLFSRLGDASARNLVLAHELCAREAALAPAEGPHALLAALVPEYATGSPQSGRNCAESQARPAGASAASQQSEPTAPDSRAIEVPGEEVGGG